VFNLDPICVFACSSVTGEAPRLLRGCRRFRLKPFVARKSATSSLSERTARLRGVEAREARCVEALRGTVTLPRNDCRLAPHVALRWGPQPATPLARERVACSVAPRGPPSSHSPTLRPPCKRSLVTTRLHCVRLTQGPRAGTGRRARRVEGGAVTSPVKSPQPVPPPRAKGASGSDPRGGVGGRTGEVGLDKAAVDRTSLDASANESQVQVLPRPLGRRLIWNAGLLLLACPPLRAPP